MPKIKIGDNASLSKTFSSDDIIAFAEASGDENPVHLDETFAAGSQFKKRIAHGMLVAGLISAVLGTQLPGEGTIYLSQDVKFKRPVYIGDTITATVTVTKTREDKPIATLSTQCHNQNGKLVIDGEATVLVP
jgi:acyl dehydratase